MHTSSPTDSSQSASSPTTSDTPAWPPPTIQAPVRRKPLPHTRTASTSTGTSTGDSAGTSAGTSSTGYPYPSRLRPGKQRPSPGPSPGGGGGSGGGKPGGKRFYSSPMTDTSKTPLQEYGLEQREPSIFEDKEKDKSTKLLRRVSHALDDIKEDFSLQLDSSRDTADRMRLRRRESAFFSGGGDGKPPPSSMPSPLGALRNGRPETAASRPLSIFSLDLGVRGGRRLSRRLSMFGSNLSQRRKQYGESISQPNLIGSSTHM